MRIVQISTGYDISTNGGITNYVRNLSESLAKMGNEVIVIYSQDDGSVKNYLYQCIPFNPILRPFHRNSVIDNKDVNKLEKIITRINPDIIHVHMMIDLPIDVLKMFQKHAKLVISLHDYSFICNRIVLVKKDGSICNDSHENNDCNFCIEKFETTQNRVLRKIELYEKQFFFKDKIMPSKGHHERLLKSRENLWNANALLPVSNRVKEIYEQNGFSNERFIVNHIGNYTAEESFRTQFLNKKPINNGEKIKFGFIGSFRRIKGAEIFLKLAKNSRHEFHIYGNMDEDQLPKIALYPNVFYHGEYRQDDLIEILTPIHIGLVLPIWEDNAPQVVFEFLNANIPVIATRKGGIPDFVHENNGILFNPEEDEINKICQFINSDEIYAFYNKVINNFKGTKTPSQHSNEILELYNSF
jgi:glycosyltransferase involved in cell wall biosynthesis